MTPTLSANSHADSLTSSLRMTNPTEEIREEKGIYHTTPETHQEILQGKTDEESNLQEDPISQTRHSRMNVGYTRTMSELTVEWI